MTGFTYKGESIDLYLLNLDRTYFGWTWRGTYYGDYEQPSDTSSTEFGTTGVVTSDITEHAPHSKILDYSISPEEFLEIARTSVHWAKTDLDLYPHPEIETQCVDHEDCHRPCHKKFLRDGECSTTPQEQYDPSNFLDVIYPF